jgi:hypothetical protein
MQSVRCKSKLRPLASAQAVGNSTRVWLKNDKGSSTLRECGHRYDSSGAGARRVAGRAGQSWHDHMTISSLALSGYGSSYRGVGPIA